MPRATCRCGQELNVPGDGTGRAIVVCPKCNARVRVRVGKPRNASADGFIRFFCTCGRRLKVSGEQPPKFGKCPDCGKVVPVPTAAAAADQPLPPNHPETPTEELMHRRHRHLGRVDAPSRREVGPRLRPAHHRGRLEHRHPDPAAHRPGRGRPPRLPEVRQAAPPERTVTCRDCGAAVPKR